MCVAFSLLLVVCHLPWLELYRYVMPAIFMGWLLTLAIVMFFSTFVSPFVALFTSLIVYVLGHMMSFVVYYVTELKSVVFSPLFVSLVRGLYLIWPNYTSLSFYDFINVPAASTLIPSQFISSVMICVIYIVLLLTLSLLIFRKKQL